MIRVDATISDDGRTHVIAYRHGLQSVAMCTKTAVRRASDLWTPAGVPLEDDLTESPTACPVCIPLAAAAYAKGGP